jgi:tripartite ATP-independent transporter DctM subunit
MAVLFFVVLVAFFITGMPVVFAIGITPIILMMIQEGSLSINMSIIAQKMYAGINSFVILSIPFFFLAGRLMNEGGMTDKIFKFANNLVGHWRGGLGHVNILASMIFAGMTGTAVSDAAGLGAIELKAMREAGYDDEFSLAITGTSATIGPIIPPSLPLVLYGILSGTSIGKLLIGGLLPGILIGIVLMIMVKIWVIKRNYPQQKKATFKEIWISFKESCLSLITPVIIIGGMMSGIFTPTEAASIASLYALILGVFIYRKLSLQNVWKIFYETAKDTAIVLFIISTASLYGWLLIRTRIPIVVLEYLTSLTNNRYIILLILNLLLLFIGCFMETIASIGILVPIIVPLLVKYGIDPVHFGVVMVFNLVIGLLTPPFGEILFILNKISGVPLERVIKAVLPFLIPLFVALAIITYFPPIVTWLPNLLFAR